MALTRLGLNQSINLATNTTGTLAVANGGTGLSSGFVNGTTNVGKVLQVQHTMMLDIVELVWVVWIQMEFIL